MSKTYKVVVNQEQVKMMSSNEVAKLLMKNRSYEIIRNQDGSIKEINQIKEKVGNMKGASK